MTASIDYRSQKLPRRAEHLPRRGVASAVAVLFLGVVLLEPRLGPNAALVDPVLLTTSAYGLVLIRRGGAGPAADTWRRASPWLLAMVVASLLSLYDAGLVSWALLSIGQNLYATAIFFGMYAVCWSLRAHVRLLAYGLTAGILLTVAALFLTLEAGVRPSGPFYHPNYAGHFLVLAAICCWYGLPRRSAGCAAVAVAGAGVIVTASFGALLMAFVFMAYRSISRLRRRPWLVAYVAAAMVLGLWAGGGALAQLSASDVQASSTLSGERLERSGSGRFAVWEESLRAGVAHPLGVGPDGLHNRDLITIAREPHNLYVAFYAERGPLGLLGLLGFGVALWRHATPGSRARGLILACAVGNLVRETFNYRHMWLILALVLVLDGVGGPHLERHRRYA